MCGALGLRAAVAEAGFGSKRVGESVTMGEEEASLWDELIHLFLSDDVSRPGRCARPGSA